MTTYISDFRSYNSRAQIRSVCRLIIIIITLNLLINFLKPISIIYIYYFELSSTPICTYTHRHISQ